MSVLGLDIGTNSIGWGIVNEQAQKIENCGVYIFPEGVKREKGNESSKAAERTAFRAARRLKFRRRLRKYETLKVLIRNQMCPLTLEELETWRTEKIYPTSPAFIAWCRTDESKKWEPYCLRKKCTEVPCEQFEIGRALYHIAQRRGFLSNRKETTKETDGKVSAGIEELSNAKGDKTLGAYFYELKTSGEKVRGRYTARKEHYEAEFNKICEVQKISDELKAELHKAIFFQRKLKSQKFLVGKCTLETDKPRCPISHIEFEEFRMLSFINSIRIFRNSDEDDNQNTVSLFDEYNSPQSPCLTHEEIALIQPLFFRSSKPNFTFQDISKKLKGHHDEWKFNYRDDTNVAGCPVSAGLQAVFGDDWKQTRIGQYDILDIWHVLFDFDDDEKLRAFAENKLHLDSEQTKKFCNIRIQQGYANLSLKAIRKILPFLQKGSVYAHAVFLANIPTMIGKDVYDAHAEEIENAVQEITGTLKDKNTVIAIANRCIEAVFKDTEHDFRSEEWNTAIVDEMIFDTYGKRTFERFPLEQQRAVRTEIIEKVSDALKIAATKNPSDYKYPALRTDSLIENYLKEQGFAIKKNAKLYHPSDTEYSFENPVHGDDGKLYLGSPRCQSVKNPVALRALHQLRKLVNYLIKTGTIDSETRVHIELANEVNDKNWRKAIEEFQRDNQKKNDEYKKRIVELCKEQGFDVTPTDSDIKKYRLWKEQNETCPYTGKKINATDLFGEHPKFDFEHTIPRSLSYDDSLENLTLCDSHYNRTVKKQHIPSELPHFDKIEARFQKFYAEKISECLATIERNKTRGGYVDPSVKDARIVKRHKARLELAYYKGKLKRFTATEVTSGFKHSQLNDTRIITKFALSYLKSVFPHTFPVKGAMTDTFKQQWGLGDFAGDNKDRTNYRHHAVDALTVACVNRAQFNLLSEAIRNSSDGAHLKFAKPWESFDSDVRSSVQYIIPKHFASDNSLRQSKKILRDRYGKPILKNGHKVYVQGNTARGALHKDTFYGCIVPPPEKDGKTTEPIFVQRVPCETLTKESAEKIIDKGIRNAFLQNLETGKQPLADIQEKGILLPYKLNGKETYVKRVRIKAKPTAPIPLKPHNNSIKKNPKEYKQHYYVVNDENYLIALYRGKDANGKAVSDYVVSNLLEAVKNKQVGKELYPSESDKKGTKLSLYKVLKIGKIVILQENETEDVWTFSNTELWKRIYRIAGLAKSGNQVYIKLAHIISSNVWEYLPGVHLLNEGVEFRRYQSTNFIGLVESTDFTISPAGEIIRM
ncbi:MAG: type II CRISPR RNA-guided endonuclease Cas9 [Treponema sp.]|nr:type II CRISPR RNA-guided endonuclease Cas9 [Treponema sp.]